MRGLLEGVDEETGAEFGFEPGALRGHDLAGVGDGHELVDSGRIHGKSDCGFAGIDELDEFAGAADAADEIDALAGAGIVDAEDGSEEAVLQAGDVELGDGVGVGGGLPGKIVPSAVEIHADFAGAVGGSEIGVRRPEFGDGEGLGDGGEECFLGVAVEVFDGAVVGEDLELARGKEDGEEPVVVFVASVGGISGAAFATDADGAGGAVMSVGDVGDGYLAEGFDEVLGAGHTPHGVLNAIGRGEVVERRGLAHFLDEAVDGGRIAVGQEDWAGVGAQGADEPGAVIFFVPPGFLMLLDDVALVIFDVADGGHADLDVGAHALLVKVNAGLALADQGAFLLEFEEVLAGLRVNGVGIWVSRRRQIDLGTIDVQEAVGMSSGEGGGFLAIHDVVGNAGDLGGERGFGAKSLESFDAEHRRERKRDDWREGKCRVLRSQ